MNAFEAYAERARIIANKPPPMLGPLKTRAAARERYAVLVAELHALTSTAALERWLIEHRQETAQFASAMEFLWLGDGSAGFRGLRDEIEWARARVDDRLDFPRWDFGHPDSRLAVGEHERGNKE